MKNKDFIKLLKKRPMDVEVHLPSTIIRDDVMVNDYTSKFDVDEAVDGIIFVTTELHSNSHSKKYEKELRKLSGVYHPLHPKYVGHNAAKAANKAICICRTPDNPHPMCPFHGR